MARIKKIFNGTTFELTTPKSGNSLLNEKTRLSRQDSKIKISYITNGYNTDNLIIDTKYNDNNTLNFNSDIININNILDPTTIATPSTIHDIDTIQANNIEIINKFTVKKDSIETKFNAFSDKEYSENNTLNQDFIKGEGQYEFLDSNLYEETAIDIELDVPVNALLEYSAYMQENDADTAFTYLFSKWDNSPYTFRNTNTELHPRTNSPFLIYNFEKNCFEARGWSRKTDGGFEGNTIESIPKLNFNISPVTQNILITDNQNYADFKNNLNFNLKNHNFTLTNTPINDLNVYNSSPIDIAETNNKITSTDTNYLSVPTMQFGFPHFPAFHAFDNNLLSMSKYLNKPLIIDRVTVNLDVKLKSEISTIQESEDLYINDGLNFSLNYFILNSPKNKKQKQLNFLKIKPFALSQDIFINNDESINTIEDLQSIISSNDLSFIFALFGRLQNTIIYRKFFNLQNEDALDNIATDISFHKNIVSFGNIVFNAPNKNQINNDNSYTTSRTKILNQIQNNNSLLIDTFKLSNLTKSQLDDNKIYLDFEGNIRVNDYIKKSSSTTIDLASHNINHQLEFKANLISSEQSTVESSSQPLKVFTSQTTAANRNMLNEKLDGKDISNALSFLESSKDLGFRKTSKNLFDETFLNQNNINQYYIENIKLGSNNFWKKSIQQFSPYVITPNDNLAFCFSISPTISSKLFKHACYLKKGKIKFTLHGYMKKNNEKFQDYNLKNLDIIGNDSIVIDDYSNIGYLTEYISTFYDRIFEGTFNLNENPISRKLDDTNTTSFSKILSGKSYIPYLKLFANNNSLNDEFIYDDKETYMYLIQKMLSSNISNLNPYKVYTIAKELSFYKNQRSEEEIAISIQNNTNINALKTSNQIYSAPGQYENQTYAQIYDSIVADLTAAGTNALLAAILALIPFATLVSTDVIWDLLINGDKRYLNSYVVTKKYGQYNNFIEQRPYTTVINSTGKIDYVIEQNFINTDTGVEITDLNNVITRNKSKYLNLIDAGYKSITTEGVVTPWDAVDFYNRVHVLFNDSVSAS